MFRSPASSSIVASIVCPKHDRILGRLVIPLGRRQQCDVQVLTKIEACRTNQVADILYEKYIHLVQCQLVQGRVQHVSIQVAGAARAYLNCCYAFLSDSFGIIFGFQVSLDDRNVQVAGKLVDRCLQQRRLAGTR